MQLEDYTTGTVSISNGSATLTGSGTAWDVAGFKAGDTFHSQGLVGIIASVDSDTAITLRDVWAGTSITGDTYLLRYQPDNSRMQGTTRQVLDELRQGIWLTPDATGKTADKATYDARPAGFRFLDVSVDPFKLYVKESDTSGDWSAGASWVGPAGDDGTPGEPGSSDVVGTSTTSLTIATGSKTFAIAETDRGWGIGARLRVSSDANGGNFMEGVVTAYADDSLVLSIDRVGGSGTFADWTINLVGEPGEDGKSFEWQGDWATGTAYAVDDVVAQGGSSYICVTAHTAGTFATDLSAGKWELMAQKGADGTGAGDVVGPSSATDGNVMVADGVTGKKVKDGGKSIADLLNASNLNAGTVPNAQLPAGLRTPVTVATDANNIITNGTFFVAGTAANVPDIAVNGYLAAHVQNNNSGLAVRQVWLEANGNRTYQRYCWYSTTWTAWDRLYLTQAEQAALWVAIDTDTALTAGYTATAANDGTKSSGTYAPSPAGGNLRKVVNGGAFTLAAPSASGDYTMVIQITNNASAGVITLSGFTKATGDSFTTTNGDDFLVYITKLNGFTHAQTVSLQ